MKNEVGRRIFSAYIGVARNQIRAVTLDGVSGCPVFLVVDQRLVFLFSKHMGWRDVRTWSPYWGPMISHLLTEIQSVIDEWEAGDSSSYQLNILPAEAFDQFEIPGGGL